MLKELNLISPYINLIEFLRDPIKLLTTSYQKHGDYIELGKIKDPVIIALGAKHNQMVNTTEYFEQIPSLIKRKPNSPITTLAANLFNMNGDQHLKQRKMIMPFLNRGAVKLYYQDMINITLKTIEAWQCDKAFDMAEATKLLTLMIASKALFNLDVKDEALAISTAFKNSVDSATNPLSILFQKDIAGTPYHTLVERSQKVVDLIQALIDKKRAMQTTDKDLLSMLIRARDDDGTAFTNTELIGQTYLMFQAAHETTTNTLNWTIFLLSQHPKVLKKLFNEIDSSFNGEIPSFEQIEKLPYLEAVVKESMRILPTTSFWAKKCRKDYNYENLKIEKGSVVIVSPYMTQRIAEIYKEPKRFIPERWETINPSIYEYCPFGFSAYSCLGAKFAMIEMKLILTLILQRYRFSLVPKSKIDRTFKITLFPKYGLPMYLAKQDGIFEQSEFSGNIKEMIDF